ncbi:hypothetical protein [Neorhizobium sp. NCHU2750]|uniref:hypothetical protein n=1 Tax=Neorhizobium sp. NCHU2750 TaxID=1825976 RepID=UPI000E719A5D|nr:hypothetical protein NCHU2750_22210 [Neorhizobium sp. NCHU2750]
MTTHRKFSSSGTSHSGFGDRLDFMYLRRHQGFRASSPTTSTLLDMQRTETDEERLELAAQSATFITQIGQLKMMTGYTWDRLAELLSCSRQSLYNWRDGLTVTDANIRAVQRMHEALAFIDRGDPTETRAVLEANGALVFKTLKGGDLEEGKRLAGKGSGSTHGRPPPLVNGARQLQDHWTDRIAASSDDPLENGGFKPRKTSRRGPPRTK